MFQHIATFLTVRTRIRFALDELMDAIHDDLRAAYKLLPWFSASSRNLLVPLGTHPCLMDGLF